MHRFFSAFWRWRHAGEEAATAIYSNQIAARAAAEFLVLGVMWAVLRVRYHDFGFGIAAVLLVWGNIGERRRAIVFTTSEVVYRPAYGPPVRVPFGKIVTLKAVRVARSFGISGIFVSGLRLSLTNGETRVIATDFTNWQEIHQRIAEATGCDLQ